MTAISHDPPDYAALTRGRDPSIPEADWRVGRSCVRLALVFLLFSLATAFVFRQFVAHPGLALIGPPEDNMNDFWNTWYTIVAHDPGHFFRTRLLRFPEGTSLIYQSFNYPQLFAIAVLTRLFGTGLTTLVALQNITLLASFPLAGLGAFYLVRYLTGSTPGGILGGYIFSFSPWHVAQAFHHAGVSSIEFIPFFALAYLLALDRRSIAWLATAAILYALCALSCWYYLFYCAYFMGFQLLYVRVRDGAWPRGWALVAPALCLVSAAILLSPLIVPMVLATHASVYEPGGNVFVADLAGFLAVPPQHLLGDLTSGLYARFSGHPWEATVYLGIANVALLGWACWRAGFSRNSRLFYAIFGMLVFGVLACGETLHVAGFGTHVPLPDAVLDRLPFFANVRTPSRAIVFVYLFLSIGVGYAIAAILRERRLGTRAAALGISALILADFYPATVAATPVTCPRGLAVLDRDHDKGFGVLNFPWGYAEEDSYMLDQVCHRRPIVDGMTTRNMGNTLLDRLALTDLRKQRAQLARAHVKYILLHWPKRGLYAWNRELAPVAQFRKSYRTVYDGPDLTILRVY